MRSLITLLAGCFAISAAQAGEPTPLFAGDSIIEVKLEGPIRELVRKASRSTDPYPATLTLGDGAETHAIELSARGKSRRDTNLCQFPPLRVAFSEKPGDASLFDKQGKLKLVTHCKSSASYQQLYLTEYAIYKMMNALTSDSFRVRMAHVSYVDSGNGKEIIARTGFFIEDVDDLARRVGKKEVELPELQLAQVDKENAARVALFNYMIGSLDWALLDGPAGDSCCHNGKVIGAEKTSTDGLSVIPYDFDYSGLVDAPYAIPPDGIKVRSVKTRVYRGFCAHNAETLAAAADFRAKRAEIESALTSTPEMSDKTKSKSIAYLGGFFDEIATDESVEDKILKRCRS